MARLERVEEGQNVTFQGVLNAPLLLFAHLPARFLSPAHVMEYTTTDVQLTATLK